jgi:hypothetical protein
LMIVYESFFNYLIFKAINWWMPFKFLFF